MKNAHHVISHISSLTLQLVLISAKILILKVRIIYLQEKTDSYSDLNFCDRMELKHKVVKFNYHKMLKKRFLLLKELLLSIQRLQINK